MNDEQIREALRRLAYAILDRVSQVDFDPGLSLAAVRQTLNLCEAEVRERNAELVAQAQVAESRL